MHYPYTEKPNIIAVIPAKAISTRCPGKNIRELAGKPLVEWSIHALQRCKTPLTIVVTTDSEIITFLGERNCIHVVHRDEELCRADVGADKPVLKAVEQIEEQSGHQFDFVICKQPTSPFITPQIIDNICDNIAHNNWVAVQTIYPAPGYYLLQELSHRPKPINYNLNFNRNSSIVWQATDPIIWRRDYVAKSIPLELYETWPVYYEEGLDIDTEYDWQVAEYIASKM